MSIRLGTFDYALALCRQVLARFPQDVRTLCLLAQAALEQGHASRASKQFKKVLALDPENILARSGLGVAQQQLGDLSGAIEQFEQAYELSPNNTDLRESLQQLYALRDGEAPPTLKVSRFSVARWRLRQKQYAEVLAEVEWLLAEKPACVAPKLAWAEALWRSGQHRKAEQACQRILEDSPDCLKAKLILAAIQSSDGARERQGVDLLHEALSLDPSGTVARAVFGDSNLRVPSLFEDIEIDLPRDLAEAPPEVEAALSLAPRLLATESEEEWTPPLDLIAPLPQEAPKSCAHPDVAHAYTSITRLSSELLEGRPKAIRVTPRLGALPVYTLISSKTKIIAKYGLSGFQRLEAKLRELQEVLRGPHSAVRLIYVDDESSLSPYGLTPIDPTQPTAVKGVIDRLEQDITQNGGELAHLLIIGGDSVIPFFRLRNPAEDDDGEVLSDNPYASGDAEFLIPERSVGRFPDGEDSDLSLLLAQIETASAQRRQPVRTPKPLGCLTLYLGLAFWLKRYPFLFNLFRLADAQTDGFGYSSLVWWGASEKVYRTISDIGMLRLSPPITDALFESGWLINARFHYFNLHGAENTEYWYGQKDQNYPLDFPLLPIALSPQTVGQADVSGSIVYTEACYGANILSKKKSSSIALRFMAEGALGLVGSTKISYGVSAPPLSGADLLGLYFWQNVKDGLPLGEALRKAKVSFLNATLERQGWLDGDDQKTLLEFVLYGDPAARLEGIDIKKTEQKIAALKPAHSRPHLFCQRKLPSHALGDVSQELVYKVVQHVVSCYPEMSEASLRFSCRESCRGQCGAACQCGKERPHRHVVDSPQKITTFTSQKSLPTQDGAHLSRIARVTVDHSGNIIKTLISK
ncbi:MAG: tetratricopeptide repeat protein [Chloroflexi bacterium]|nr:tetratricopeptide repeat protein [Chloroflexota bacterium]MCL5075499.1 tetratricopeptide repeat protein [Chloroflexota bacterium]